MGKIIFILFLLFASPLLSAEVTTLGTFQIDKEINLPQVANATACNITSIRYPNSTIFIENVAMQKDGTDFNFTLDSSFTNVRGVYLVNGECDTTIWTYDFEISPTGTTVSTAQSLIYIIFFIGALLLFSFCLFWIFNLPSGNNITPAGEVVSLNDLKFLRLFLIPVSYVLLTWIFGILRSVTANFLILNGPNAFFNWAYWIMMAVMYPLLILSLYIFLISIFNDRKILKSLREGRPFNINEERR